MSKENVKVSTTILNKVRKYVKQTNQKVGGFYDIAVLEKLEREKFNQATNQSHTELQDIKK